MNSDLFSGKEKIMNKLKLNIQLFASADNVNKTTDGTLSPEMKTFYDKTLITLASPYLVHDQFGQKRDIPAGGGKVIEFRRFSALPKALTPLTEGVTPDGNKLNVSSVTASVEQYGDYVEQSDVLELTAVDNTIVEATKQLSAQAGLTLDTIVRNEVVGGTNVIYSSASGENGPEAITSRYLIDASAPLTVKDVFKAAAELKAMNAPKINGYYVGIIHPYVAYDLMQEAGNQWMEVQKYASPENMLSGEIGCLGGVRFVESTEAKIFKGEPFAGKYQTLTVGTALSAASRTVELSEKLTSKECQLLSDRKIIIGGKLYTVASASAGAGSAKSSITLSSTDEPVPVADGAEGSVIYPGEGGKNNAAVFATMIIGADAYGVTSVNGGGIEHIVKQKGYGNDPLNQRSSVGWKALKTAKRLVEEYMVRIESGSAFSETAQAN